MTTLKTLRQSITGMCTIAFLATSINAGEPCIVCDKEPIAQEPLFKFSLDSRIRYSYGEFEDPNPNTQAHAITLRNRLGLLTKEIAGFQFFAEYEGTLPLEDNTFRVPGVPNHTNNRSVIADPRSHELNEIWLNYNANDTINVRVGRQAVNLNNQRYIGTVGWRQNEQTLDAAKIDVKGEKLDASYTYFNKVNRIFGSEVSPIAGTSDFEGDSHLINVNVKDFDLGKLNFFVYSLDLTNGAGASAASTNSFGVSLAGGLGDTKASYYLEYGYQTDAYDSPWDYAAHYGHGSVSFPLVGKMKATAGIEYLGSDNGFGYQFPLSTLHKFNGFADAFLVSTPSTGLADAYFKVATPLPAGFSGLVAYHHFNDDSFDETFGNELDFVVKKKLTDNVLFLTKGAFYFSEGGSAAPFDIYRMTAEFNIKF